MSNLTEHQAKVLQKLKDAGLTGLNSYSEFRKDNALQISGTIRELREKGYSIRSVRKNGDRSATYILLHPIPLSSPSGQDEEKPAPQLIPRPQGWSPEVVEPTPEESRVDLITIEAKLTKLRGLYKAATLSEREIITRRAKALQIAKDKLLKKKAP